MENIIYITSGICKESDFSQEWYTKWINAIQQRPMMHRKQWEFAVIAQALYERGLLQPGKRGLGFGVGIEPLVPLFASYGVDILATDLSPDNETAKAWTTTNQHITNSQTNLFPNICPDSVYAEHVKTAYVDMNHIPADLKDFDFTWSACSMEHLGSIKKGKEFLLNQLKCLKPGGWAIHTTELNVGSEHETIDNNNTVLFLKKNIQDIIRSLQQAGHFVEVMNWDHGNYVPGDYVDVPPNNADPHLRLALGSFVSTSMVFVIRKRKFTQDTRIGKLAASVGKKLIAALSPSPKASTVTNAAITSIAQVPVVSPCATLPTATLSVPVSEHVVLSKIFTGQMIYVDTRDMVCVAPHIIMNGTWEMWTTEWLMKLLKPDTVFIDVGANWGFFSLVAKSIIDTKKGAIYAIEPNPEVASLLRKTFIINVIPQEWVREVALGDSEKEAILHVSDDSWGSGSLIANAQRSDKQYKVKQLTLDKEMELLGLNKVDVIKIDAEGVEDLVMKGAEKTLKHNPNVTIISEFTAESYQNPHEYYDTLSKKFAHIYVIHENKEVSELHSFTELLAKRDAQVCNLILTNSPVA